MVRLGAAHVLEGRKKGSGGCVKNLAKIRGLADSLLKLFPAQIGSGATLARTHTHTPITTTITHFRALSLETHTQTARAHHCLSPYIFGGLSLSSLLFSFLSFCSSSKTIIFNTDTFNFLGETSLAVLAVACFSSSVTDHRLYTVIATPAALF